MEPSLLIRSLPILLEGAITTIQISFFAIIIGISGGLLVGIANCSKLRHSFLGFLLNGFVWTVRGTPLFIQLLIVYYAIPEVLGFSLSPFSAGVITLGINSTAYISEIVRSGIDAIPEGQWEASYVLGIKPYKTLQGIILPQMFLHSLPGITNELTALIKESSILMVIGVMELTKASKDIVLRELDPMTIYFSAAFLYLLMTSTVSYVTQWAKKGAQSC